jgi:hypothetical protein
MSFLYHQLYALSVERVCFSRTQRFAESKQDGGSSKIAAASERTSLQHLNSMIQAIADEHTAIFAVNSNAVQTIEFVRAAAVPA